MLSKKKRKKKTPLSKRIRTNARSIVIVVVLISIFSGLSFYLGVATPRSYTVPIALTGNMALSLEYTTVVGYAPHTGVRVTFDCTSNSHSWSVAIFSSGGDPLDQLSGSGTGIYSTASWLYSPDECRILIRISGSIPSSMNLDGTLTITSSRFPFI